MNKKLKSEAKDEAVNVIIVLEILKASLKRLLLTNVPSSCSLLGAFWLKEELSKTKTSTKKQFLYRKAKPVCRRESGRLPEEYKKKKSR